MDSPTNKENLQKRANPYSFIYILFYLITNDKFLKKIIVL